MKRDEDTLKNQDAIELGEKFMISNRYFVNQIGEAQIPCNNADEK